MVLRSVPARGGRVHGERRDCSLVVSGWGMGGEGARSVAIDRLNHDRTTNSMSTAKGFLLVEAERWKGDEAQAQKVELSEMYCARGRSEVVRLGEFRGANQQE